MLDTLPERTVGDAFLEALHLELELFMFRHFK